MEGAISRARKIYTAYKIQAKQYIDSAKNYNPECILSCHTALVKTLRARYLLQIRGDLGHWYFETLRLHMDIKEAFRVLYERRQTGNCECVFDFDDPTFTTDDVHAGSALNFFD